ncbi:MAG: hypothetical protein ABI238_02980 [Terrimesophilobacter sp.]
MSGTFDPRFDPRFQPGFQPGSEHELGADTPANDVETDVETETDVEVEVEVESDEAVVADEPFEPNPFERTLWSVAGVLVVGGIAAAFWANGVNYYGSGTAWTLQQMLQSSAWSLSGPAVTVGLAIGVGLLFRRAIGWTPPE